MTSKYEIRLTSKAEKDYKRLNPQVETRIKEAILKLEEERHPPQFKPLSGKEIAQFRIRVGDYRILYDLYAKDKVVLILRIGHRKDIYR